MTNWDANVARRYHEATKHSYESIRGSAHGLDWSNRPNPFKEYRGVEAVPLAAAAQLERLLRLGAGVVRHRDGFWFRTYSSAGALYPIELYVAAGEPAGLFHFHPRELELRRLRDADVRAVLAEAADAPELADAAAVLILTGTLWRTAWKYEARGYRHVFWDAGTMVANLLAAAADERRRTCLATAFVDERVDRILGLDGRHEVSVALVAIGDATPRQPESTDVPPLHYEAEPLSRHEVRYAIAEELHAASRLRDVAEVRRWRDAAGNPPAAEEPAVAELEPVLSRRDSIRELAQTAGPRDDLAGLLARTAAPIAADGDAGTRIAFVANAVDGLASGLYRFEPPDRFELVRAGSFRRLAGHLVLGQELGARAAVTAFFMADLDDVLARLGNRGYRLAQLEAGIRAGRAQVGAFALGWGATASTFFDDDVSEAFETREAPMLCVAIGRR